MGGDRGRARAPLEGAQARLCSPRAHTPEQLSPRCGGPADEDARRSSRGERDRRAIRICHREHVPHRRREPASGPAVRCAQPADRPRDGSERGDPQGRDRRGRRAFGRARDRPREEPFHVLGVRSGRSRRSAARARGLRSRRHHESRKGLSGRRRLRGHSDRAHEESARRGHVGVALGLNAHDIDGLAPARVIRATSETEVVEAIRGANERSEAIVVSGGATRLTVGDPPARYDAALNVSALRGIVEYEPADLVATVRAGTTLAELAEALAPHAQRWPVEAGLPDRATEGGTLASAAGGPARLRDFHPRDWVIGARVGRGDAAALRLDAKWTARLAWPAGTRPEIDFAGYDAVIYPGNATAYLLRSIDRAIFRKVRASLEAADGVAVLERASADYKRDVGGAWGAPRVPLGIARALKERFDPRGVLAPGRVPE